MARTLRVIAYVWAGIVVLGNLLGIVGAFLSAKTFWEAVNTVQGWYSPLNLWTYGLNILLLSPAFILFWIAKRRGETNSSTERSTKG